ncbi:SpvB/TcaC N-terminal domain-containing protein, partial [Pseudoalteromonas holothuriae]|uniref:SpvB/TcaC N-terminal domain-containing protein n=1 Tax=Pseudoalteromonas holothuriae TaxID=2963714 RepID=UPI0021C171AD
MNTFEPQQLTHIPTWVTQPSNPTTHKTITLQWSTDTHASHYELWLNGSKYTYTTNRAEFYFTTPELKLFKVRSCDGHICSPFSQSLKLDFKKRLELSFGELGVIEAGSNQQIALTLLEQVQVTDKVEFSLNKDEWRTSQGDNAQYTYLVNISEPGEYLLHVKINGERIKPLIFRVYGQPTKAVGNLSLGRVGQMDYQNQQTLVLSSPEDLILHFQASDEIAPPMVGYYKYRIENSKEGIIFQTPPYLKYQYGHNEFHIEIPIKNNGKYDIALRGCNRLSSGEVCGPTQIVHVYIGVPATPYRKPTQPVSGVYINGVLGDTTRNEYIEAEPDSAVYLSWSKSPEVDTERGYYLIEVDYPQGHTKQGLAFGTAPYIARRYNDNDFHYKMHFDVAKQDYIVTVRACNPYNQTGGFEANCGPRSHAVRVKSKPAEVKYDISFAGISSDMAFIGQEITVAIQTQNNKVLKRLEVKLDDDDWVSLTSVDGKSFTYSFGILPLGKHNIVFKADNYYDSATFSFDVIKVPISQLKVENLSLSKSLLDYGDKIAISWQKPTYHDEPLFYDIYITKPSAPSIPYLWHSKLDPSNISFNGKYQVERGPVYMHGEHLVQVVPCTPEGVCANLTGGVSYHIDGDYLPIPPLAQPYSFINETQAIEWQFKNAQEKQYEFTLYVKKPGSEQLIELASSANNQANLFMYKFTTAGQHHFFVQACALDDETKKCSNLAPTKVTVEVINTEFTPKNTGTELLWPEVPNNPRIVIENAACASNCNMASLSWDPLVTLTNGETSYGLSDSEGKVYRIKVCFSDGKCSSWSFVGQLSLPALEVSAPEYSFINKAENISWKFKTEPKLELISTLYVLTPNSSEMVELGSSDNRAISSYEYKFKQTGTYLFFAQACEMGQQSVSIIENASFLFSKSVEASSKNCTTLELTKTAVTVINIENSGKELTWPRVPDASVVIESAMCADANTCNMASLSWDPLVTLTNGETSYGLSDSEGKVYRIKVCFSDGKCSSWSFVGQPSLPALEVSAPEYSFINKAENISWKFKTEPKLELISTLYVLTPNSSEMVELGSSDNRAISSYEYKFKQTGTYLFFAQACEIGQQSVSIIENASFLFSKSVEASSKNCTTLESTKTAVTVINIENSGKELTWPRVPDASVVIESAMCADANTCNMASLSWDPLVTLTNGETSYGLSDSEGKVYRIKMCFSDGKCSSWLAIDAVYLPSPESLFVHQEAPGNSVSFSWQMPSSYTEPVDTTFYMVAPNSNELVVYTQNVNLISGVYKFYLKVCERGNPQLCNQLELTETEIVILGRELVLEGSDGKLSWSPIDGVTHYIIEQAFCQSNCEGEALIWKFLKQTQASTYTLQENDKNQLYQVKACFFLNKCSTWSNTVIVVNNDYGTINNDLPDITDTILSTISAPTTDVVGTLPGSAGVNGGAASYNLPIQIAPGRNGVQPKVSLNYSSRSGNGIAGMGVSLSAGSQISRCSATYAQDGFTQNPQYNSNDRLCLDGQRLIAVSGNYGEDSAIYRTEIDSFVRVTQSGAINSNSTSFTVEYANGTTAYFGRDVDSRVIHSGQSAAYSWLISHQHDATSKNYIHYDYKAYGAGERLLSDIYYTGSGVTAQGQQKVSFTYEANNQPRSGYIAGGYYESTQKLKTINAYTNTSTKVRTYKLGYQTSHISGRDLLKTVRMCVGSKCLPATTFAWQNSNTQKLEFEPMSDANGTMLYQGVETLSSVLPRGDHNADGVRDWQGYYVDAEGNATENSIAFNACRQNIFTRQHECHDGDFDQDGKSDQWRIESGVLKLTFSGSGDDFNTGIAMPTDIRVGLDNSHIRQIGDFNGDGFPDIMVYVGDSTDMSSHPVIELYLHTQNTEKPYGAAAYDWGLTQKKIGRNYTLGSDVSVVGDISGDGTLDVMVTDSGASLVSPSYIQPLPSEFWLGDDNYDANKVIETPFVRTDSSPFTPNLSYFIDINGDGLPDWLGWENDKLSTRLKYRLNQGGRVSFAPEVEFEGASNLIAKRLQNFSNGSDGTDTRDVPKYYGAFKVEDIDYDGIPELLMPDTIVYEACANVFEGSKKKILCGNGLYNNYWPDGFNEGSISPINAREKDKSIYQFKALKFHKNSAGTFVVTKEATDLIGSAYDSAFIDAFGTGLRSFVFNHYLNFTRRGHVKGREPATGSFNGYEDTYGVYINRNYGAGTGATGADYAPIDMLKKVENGVGVVSEWTQRPLSSSLTDYKTGATNTDNQQGYFNFASSMYVVNKFTQSNGIGGTNTKEYGYFGAMYNAQGRGFMGFKSVIEKNVTLGVVTRSDFNQIFPYQGKLKRQAQFKATDYTARSNELLASATTETTAISHTDNTWGKQGRYVYLSAQNTTQRDVDNSHTEMFTNVLTVDTIDTCGNVTKSTQTRSDTWGDYTTTTQTGLDDAASCSNDTSKIWWPHKLKSKTVTKSKIKTRHTDDPLNADNADLDSTYAITTLFSDYHISRKPKTATVSGKIGDVASGKGKTTKTVFNDYGLPTLVSETAKVLNSAGKWEESTRTTKMTYSKDGTNEAADGYFPLVITNAKGHQVKTITDRATGQPKQQKRQVSSSKWVTTTYGYDDFYRPFSQKTEGMPIQYSAVQSTLHDDHKPSHAVMMVKQVSAGTPEVRVYKDKLGRTIRTASQAFDGSWVYQDVSFDSLGRTTYESMPYKQSGTSYGTKYSGFDVLGRPATKVVDQQCGQNTTGTMDVTYGYSGLTTTIDVSETCHSIALGQMSRTYNSLKQLVRTKDAAGNFTYYGYNSLGLPAVIEDAAGNQIKATYNALGRKTKVDDPNQGVTGFTYNGFGELQQETRGSTTVKLYVDVLGRVVTRTATGENNLSYSYDANNGYGQMTVASGNGVTHSYGFDTLGRPTTHTVSGSGKSYTTSTLYDGNYGRVKGVRYPNNLTLEYTYNNKGYQTSVKNAANDYVYQTVESQDILGNITQSALGNGLIQKQYYSLTSGQMTGSYTETDNSQQLMALNYTQYDGFGNLKAMTVTTGSFDNQHSFSESYVYDDLHRLTSNKIDGITTISYGYDAVGNLTSKSDYASEYNYSDHLSGHAGGGANAVKKVQKTDGTWVGFSYDARGNMTKGDGLTSAIYNAMDKPTSLTKNGITSTFVYGPDHMRFKQV